jgi:hypothetical protein
MLIRVLVLLARLKLARWQRTARRFKRTRV